MLRIPISAIYRYTLLNPSSHLVSNLAHNPLSHYPTVKSCFAIFSHATLVSKKIHCNILVNVGFNPFPLQHLLRPVAPPRGRPTASPPASFSAPLPALPPAPLEAPAAAPPHPPRPPVGVWRWRLHLGQGECSRQHSVHLQKEANLINRGHSSHAS